MIDTLARALSPAYSALRPFTPEVRGHAAALVDIVVEESLATPPSFADDLALIAAMPPHEAEVVLDAWAASVTAAKPERGTMKFILERFPAWYQSCPPLAREPWLAGMPKLAPAAKGVADEGMSNLCLAMEATGDPYTAHKLIESAASYAMTTDPAIRAIAALQLAAARHQRPDLWLQIAQSFPAERLEENRDAENFLPALAKMVEASREEAVPALELGAVLAANNASSARAACEKFAAAAKPGLFSEARDVIATLGTRAIGASLTKLPNPALIVQVLEMRREYGVQAALRLLERGSL